MVKSTIEKNEQTERLFREINTNNFSTILYIMCAKANKIKAI